MRHALRALALALATLLAPAQVVEESLAADPGPLDFIQGDSYEQWVLQSLAGDALVGLGPDGRVVPRLAAAWTLEGDGALSFTLRTDARFGDGSPVTAEDALWTFRELRRHPRASPTKRALLEGAEFALRQGRLWLRSPRPPERFLRELARVPIAQRGRPDQGSGPFAFRHEAGAWVFTRREHFLGPRIAGVRFRLLPEPAAVQTALRKGWLSLGAPLARAQADPPPGHSLLVQPLHAQFVVWSRRGAGPLRLLERWRAEAFPPGLLGLNARPSRGLWPETLGFRPRAIWTGPLPRPGPLTLHYPAGDALLERLLLALRERARRDGFDLRLLPLEQGLLQTRLTRGDFELAGSLVFFEPHPWAVLEYLEPEGPMNFTGWRHPELAALAARLRDPGAPAWEELQGLWAREPAALPLLDFQSVLWVDRRLQVEPSPLGLYLHTPGAAGWRWR